MLEGKSWKGNGRIGCETYGNDGIPAYDEMKKKSLLKKQILGATIFTGYFAK
jgi:hypothetical protein